jgi:predicted ATPase
MLSKWRLENFKSVYEAIELDLKPLNVFAGPNSSGKSTVIQSMLLVAQTASNQVFTRPVILNGHIARLGSFRELASTGLGKEDICIGLTYSPTSGVASRLVATPSLIRAGYILPRQALQDYESFKLDFSFGAPADSPPSDLVQLQPLLTSCRLAAKNRKSGVTSEIDIRRVSESPAARAEQSGLQVAALDGDDLASLQFEVRSPSSYATSSEDSYRVPPPRGDYIGARFRHFLPVSFALRYDAAERRAEQVVRSLAMGPDPSEPSTPVPQALLRRMIGLVDQTLEIARSRITALHPIRKLREGLQEDVAVTDVKRLTRLLQHEQGFRSLVQENLQELTRLAREETPKEPALMHVAVQHVAVPALTQVFTENFKYLGPLRDEPKAVYPMQAATDPADIGLRGEYTAAVLDLHKNTEILYIPAADYLDDRIPSTPTPRTLAAAVSDWLAYLDVVRRIETNDLGVYGHELRVAPGEGDALHTLVHVGVGVSQVLPILVMSLLSPPGAILVFEQPELHLHPRVQARLADFFLSLTLLDKQCVVETHSEYLINRLRLRAALDESDQLQQMFNLYFVSKEGARSRFRRVAVNEFGAIVDWPEGFFDQSPRESEEILQAALRKRQQKRR